MKLEQLEALAKGWIDDPTGDPDRVEPLARGVLSLVSVVRVAVSAAALAEVCDADAEHYCPRDSCKSMLALKEALAALEKS